MKRQLLGATSLTRTLRSMLDEVESAPNIQEHTTPGFDEPRYRLPTMPAVVGTISLDGETIPAATAAAALGISYPELEPGRAGLQVKLSHMVGKHSRFVQAGGNLVLANTAPNGLASGDEDNFYTRPERLRLNKPAAFTLLGDGLEVAESAYPVDELEVKVGDAANYSTFFKLPRKKRKALPAELVAYEIGLAISRGVANLVDKVILDAIVAAAPGAFSLGTLASKDVKIEELRAIVGTNAAGVAWRGDGTFTAANIPAELSPAIAETVAGAWNKAFAIISDETRIVLRRLDIEGGLDVMCHVNVKPGLVDADFFGLVA